MNYSDYESYFSPGLDDDYFDDESNLALSLSDPLYVGYGDDEVDNTICDDYIDIEVLVSLNLFLMITIMMWKCLMNMRPNISILFC